MSSEFASQSFGRRMNRSLNEWFIQHDVPESAVIMFTALVVGVGAGLGAVIFRLLIETVTKWSFDGLGGLLEAISPWHLVIIPALGGLIYGPLIYRFAQEAKGHGVPEIMEAVALRGGRIRPRVAVVKSLASAICIGTGGSVGREGPIAQIGSALGSTVGQLFKLSDERVRNLVACGAAGGIAATFNAPIAGSIFALEVILGRLHSVYFGAVVISAVTADVVAHVFEKDVRAFVVPEYTLVSPWELLFYTLMGALAAVAAFAFSRLLYASEDLWEEIPFPEYLKPILGGVLLGVIGILTYKVDGFPRIFGVGYNSISSSLFGEMALQVMLALFVFKFLATIITLGAGGSGGVFAPSLFMGAMLGGAFGHIVHALFPEITAPVGAYALVGMAAFFSGAAHAPVTAVLILFEMTGDYQIILPLMLATVMSTLISRVLDRESIYTLKLSRRGVHLDEGQDVDVMQGVTVGEAMTQDPDVVFSDMSLEDLAADFARTHHHGYAVLDRQGQLFGVVSVTDLKRALAAGSIENKIVADIATTTGLLTAVPNEPMWKALRRLGARDLSRLPVVAEEGSRQLIGVVRRRDIVRAYEQAIVKQAKRQHQADALRVGKLDTANFAHVIIPANSPVVGLRVDQLELPAESLIVSVRRGRKLYVAHAYTVLQVGDRVTIFADNESLTALERYLISGTAFSMPENEKTRRRELSVPVGAACIGKRVNDLSLPAGCLLVRITRGDSVIIPHGETVLQAGDLVEVFGLDDELDLAQSCLTG